MLFFNTLAVFVLVVAKFPHMHKVRIFGINADQWTVKKFKFGLSQFLGWSFWYSNWYPCTDVKTGKGVIFFLLVKILHILLFIIFSREILSLYFLYVPANIGELSCDAILVHCHLAQMAFSIFHVKWREIFFCCKDCFCFLDSLSLNDNASRAVNELSFVE